MIVSDEGQARVFLIFILFGMLCVMLADFFYVLRMRYGRTKAQVNLLDALFYSFAFLIILYAGVRFNFGALRYYQIFALGIGMIAHKLVFSNAERKAFDVIVAFVIKCVTIVLKITWKIIAFLLRGFFACVDCFEQKIMHACHKVMKYRGKVKKKRQKMKKTVKKRLRMI